MAIYRDPNWPEEKVSKVKNEFVPEELRKAALIYEHRSKMYGDNYKKFGDWSFPLIKDIKIANSDDASRFCVLLNILNKISRYVEQFNNGGHEDSLDDMAVYAMMLKELDSIALYDALKKEP